MGDWWGRAVAALGFTVAHAQHPAMRIRATRAFLRLGQQRSGDVRTAASAVIGAAEVLAVRPSRSRRATARGLLAVVPTEPVSGWHWPEERLRYANASLPEAMIAAGDVLGDDGLVETGLGYLEFLITAESRGGHLSVTGTAGRGPGEPGPFFDQQPIEVAAIADASARAYALRGDATLARGRETRVGVVRGRERCGSADVRRAQAAPDSTASNRTAATRTAAPSRRSPPSARHSTRASSASSVPGRAAGDGTAHRPRRRAAPGSGAHRRAPVPAR